MAFPMHRFGPTIVAKLSDPGEISQLLDEDLLQSQTVIIKPNWVSADPGDFTDVDTLRALIEALDVPVVVTESYMLARSLNIHPQGLPFTVNGRDVNWQWLLQGEGWQWLTEHPDWAWFRDAGHWDQIVREDQAFLDANGFSELFNEYNVTYVNVTEEVWSGRIADPLEIQRAVEARYSPVQEETLYRMVPAKLYDLRGSTFISLARMKMYASFTIKNLFGMIPDPLRPYWHGLNNQSIAQNIVDINKVYHSLFDMFGLCEALFTLPVLDADGPHKGIYSGRYRIRDGTGFVATGRDLVALDTLLLNLTDPEFRQIANVNRDCIELAQKELKSAVGAHLYDEARARVGDWIAP